MTSALRTLLAHLVDYAGLFPPAGLGMRAAVDAYAAHRAGEAAWMLGRFVVPVARLEEFEAAAGDRLVVGDDVPDDAVWRLSALVGADVAGDLARVAAFNARHAPDAHAGRAVIDVVETRAATPDDVARAADAARRAASAHGPAIAVYAEVPLDRDPAPFVQAARAAGARLKARTGGVTPDAFPAPDALLRFLAACAAADLGAKVTAGLHHPLRAEHPLTYEPGCAHGTMYGFVNVFLADALLRAGHAPGAVAPLLEARDADAFTVDDDDALAWRAPDGAVRRATADDVARARARGLASFGSCSFDEPVGDLRALRWLPPSSPFATNAR